MTIEQVQRPKRIHFLDLLAISEVAFFNRRTTHNYTRQRQSADYFFEGTEQGLEAYMTGQGRGIKPGDYILLGNATKPEHYQVEKVDYYACPSDLWIALLKSIA
jgi:MioC protein